MTDQRTALIAGASGLTGGHCLQWLLRSPVYSRVVALVRRPLPVEHPKLRQVTTDFDRLLTMDALPRVDDAFCCLGTPLNRIHDRELLVQVDFTYPYHMARLARAHGTERFVLITSSGISHHSPLYYCRVKSRIEDAVRQMGFTTVLILRPSFLIGSRPSAPLVLRIAAHMVRPLVYLLPPGLRRFVPVTGEAVGATMVDRLSRCGPGTIVLESNEIRETYLAMKNFGKHSG